MWVHPLWQTEGFLWHHRQKNAQFLCSPKREATQKCCCNGSAEIIFRRKITISLKTHSRCSDSLPGTPVCHHHYVHKLYLSLQTRGSSTHVQERRLRFEGNTCNFGSNFQHYTEVAALIWEYKAETWPSLHLMLLPTHRFLGSLKFLQSLSSN